MIKQYLYIIFHFFLLTIISFFLFLIVGLSNAYADIKIQLENVSENSSHTRFLFITDSPITTDFRFQDAPNKIGVLLSGPDIHEKLELFLTENVSFTKRACILDIKTKWAGINELLVSFTLQKTLIPVAQTGETEIDGMHHTIIEIHPHKYDKYACVGSSAVEIKESPGAKEKKSPSPFKLSGIVMFDAASVINTKGDLDESDLGFSNANEVRRARITAKGQIRDWLYKTRLDVSDLFDDDNNFCI